MVSDMCYWLITYTGNIVSKISVKNVTIDDDLKPEIESRVDDFNKNLKERLDDGNFQLNSDVDGKFDFIILVEDISENLGVKYTGGVTPTNEEYDEMIVECWTNNEEEVINKYLNMNFIFYVGTNYKHRGTMVKRSRKIDGIEIGHFHTNRSFNFLLKSSTLESISGFK